MRARPVPRLDVGRPAGKVKTGRAGHTPGRGARLTPSWEKWILYASGRGRAWSQWRTPKTPALYRENEREREREREREGAGRQFGTEFGRRGSAPVSAVKGEGRPVEADMG